MRGPVILVLVVAATSECVFGRQWLQQEESHNSKLACPPPGVALEMHLDETIAAVGGAPRQGRRKSSGNKEGAGRKWMWGDFPLPHVQLAKARKLVQAGINAAAALAVARGQQAGSSGLGITTAWPSPEECEIKHYIEDKVGKVAVVNVKRRNRPGLNGTTAALVVRNRTGVRLVEQDSVDPAEGTGCGRNIYKGYRGFEDPRMLVWNHEHLVLVNGCFDGGRHMFLYRVEAGLVVRLRLSGPADRAAANGRHAPSRASSDHGRNTALSASAAGEAEDVVEKNWTPYVSSNGALRFIYSFGSRKALGVLELVDIRAGACVLVHGTLAYDKTAPALGSTPLIPWQLPWYAGVAHTRGRAQDYRQLLPEIALDGSASKVKQMGDPKEKSALARQKRYRRTYAFHKKNPFCGVVEDARTPEPAQNMLRLEPDVTGTNDADPCLLHIALTFVNRFYQRYRAVPMVYNAETFEIRLGQPVGFAQPSNPLANPWARDGQSHIFRDVQFAFDIQVKDDRVYVGIEFQDRCPASFHIPVEQFCALLPDV